jgi:hypothetical protein
MPSQFFTRLTGRELPEIRQPRRHDERLPINEGAVAHFARILEQVGILKRDPPAADPQDLRWSSARPYGREKSAVQGA